MPKPEIHYSPAFGMGFYIAEDGTLMSMPAVTDANGRTTMDIDNEVAVDEWDDPCALFPITYDRACHNYADMHSQT